MRKLMTTASVLAIGSALGFAQPAQAEIRVGVATAINPLARSYVPAQPERVLYVGNDMYADERVVTGPAGHVQVVFLDGTVLSVGPDSDLVINRFIYDPQAKTGELAVNAVRGVFRLVGGKISKSNAIEVRTPKVVLGLRGGIATFNVRPQMPVQAIFLYGRQLTATAEGVTKTAFRPGSIIETLPGQEPEDPRPATAHEVDSALGHFTAPRREDTAGASQPAPGPRQVAALNEPAATASDATTLDAPAEKVGAAKPEAEADTSKLTGAVELPAETAAKETVASVDEAATLPADTAIPPAAVTAFSGRFLRDPPFTTFDNQTLAAPRNPLNNASITATVAGGNRLKATSPDGPQEFPYLPGQVLALDSTNSTTMFGGVGGLGFVSPDQNFVMYLFDDANAQTIAGFFAGVATPAFPTLGFGRHDVTILQDIPFSTGIGCLSTNCVDTIISPLYSAYSSVLTPAQAGTSSQRAVHMQATLDIVGSGTGQRSLLFGETGGYFLDAAHGDVAMGGGARGSLRFNGFSFTERSASPVASAETGSGNAIFGPNANYMALVPERMNPTASGLVREETAAFRQPFDNLAGFSDYPVDVAIGGPIEGFGGARTPSQVLSGFVVGIGERRVNGPNPAFVDAQINGTATIATNADINRMSASFDFASTAGDTYRLNFGDLTGEGAAGAFIDDNLFAARESNNTPSTRNGRAVTGTAFMVTSNAVPVAIIDGITPCACDFLKWGWWIAEARDNPETIRDRVHLATWVAGTVPALADLPAAGTASFSGHAIGNVLNNGAKYIAAGTYTQSWDFAARSGVATISGFDAGGSGVPGGITATHNVTGAGTAFGGGVTGNFISGSFFKDAAAASGVGVGGMFAINNGAGYQAAGTFAAKQVVPGAGL